MIYFFFFFVEIQLRKKGVRYIKEENITGKKMERFQEFRKELKQSPLKEIKGQEEVKRSIKSALLSKRNAIIVGTPGIGKTTLAKTIASTMPELEVNNCGFNCLPEKPVCPKCRGGETTETKTAKGKDFFVRVQGSPDLTAEDLIGDIDPVKAMKHGPLDIKSFTPGKIFKANNGILFFDEINRCSEKLQNALLQALAEKRVTIGSYDIDLKTEFILIATMNPEDTSTEQLSDVFLDRFDMIYMSFPEDQETEERIVLGETEPSSAEFPTELFKGSVKFVRSLREDENLEKKPSVRGSIGIYERACATAELKEKEEVTLKDLEEVVVSVLSHRISLKPSLKYVEKVDEYLKKKFKNFCKENDLSGDGP